MAFIFFIIFVLVPWQVAFLGCWLIHLYTCASTLADNFHYLSAPSPGVEAVPLVQMQGGSEGAGEENLQTPQQPTAPPSTGLLRTQQANAQLHILLFMTWLLPLVAPVLAVWVRTLATAGLTTPFDGDHNFLYVAPFLVLVEVLGGGDAATHGKTFLCVFLSVNCFMYALIDLLCPQWRYN